MKNLKILIATDEPHILKTLSSNFETVEWGVVRASSEEDFTELLDKDAYDVVISSIVKNPLKRNKALEKAKGRNPDTIIIFLGSMGDDNYNYDTLSYGAENFIFSPCGMQEIWKNVISCLEKVELKRRDVHSSELIYKFKEQISDVIEIISKMFKEELVWVAEEIKGLIRGKYGKIGEDATENMHKILERINGLIKETDSLSKGIIPEKRDHSSKSQT